jgi:lipid II:glycine glycyltransferase (peptidoglycan interpeptide bridge formation enzyme)
LSFKTKILFSVDDTEWNSFLYNSEFSTVFQTSNWVKNYQNMGSKPVFIQIESEKGIVAQLAAIIHKNSLRHDNIVAKNLGWKFNISSILTWSYGPIISDLENYSEIFSLIISLLEKIAKQHNVMMIRGSTPPLDQNNPKKLFEEYLYSFLPWSTYIIPLNQTEDTLYSSLDKKTRYDIRKSEKNNFLFEIPEDSDYPKEFYELKNEEYIRDNRKVSPISNSYEERWKNLYQNGLEKIFLAKNKNHTVSGISNIIFNGYSIQHAVANSKIDLTAGTFLTWNVVKWAIKNKIKYYDVGGINPNPTSKKEKNIDFYKSKWGGQQYSFGIYTKILNRKKQILSSILRNPKKIIKKLYNYFSVN